MNPLATHYDLMAGTRNRFENDESFCAEAA
jgi:hypothetical protein